MNVPGVTGHFTVDLHGISPGLYLLQINDRSGNYRPEKLSSLNSSQDILQFILRFNRIFTAESAEKISEETQRKIDLNQPQIPEDKQIVLDELS